METKNCSKCGNPMKGIPAGISRKTRKPYNAFYKCESCGGTENAVQTPTTVPAQGGFTAQDRKVLNSLWRKVDALQSALAPMTIDTPTAKVEVGTTDTDEIKPSDLPF